MKSRHLLAMGLASLPLAACSDRPEAPPEQPATAGATASPFAAGDAAMHRNMAAAVGVDAADSWVRKMIAHHQGAVDMSQVVLRFDPPPAVRRLAETTIERQGKEIEQLRAMVRPGTPDPASAELYRNGDEAMHRDMMAAGGATPSDQWIAKMIAHHRGAVDMSRLVLGTSPPSEVKRMAEATITDQTREIAELEAMRRTAGQS